MLTAIAGINWGDEGKGRMVDLLSEDYDIVVRYQGGNNAGHSVVNDKGRFILNLLPSGILRSTTVNIMGNGMVIDLRHLCGEIDRLRAAGIEVSPANLKISDRAVICMPYHVLMDVLEEDRRADRKFGSTRRGIAPVYADKYYKKAFRMGDLFDIGSLSQHAAEIAEWKNLTVERGYGAPPVTADQIIEYFREYGERLIPYICDTGKYIGDAAAEGKRIMFERSATSISEYIPIPHPPTPLLRTLPSERAFPALSWIRLSVL